MRYGLLGGLVLSCLPAMASAHEHGGARFHFGISFGSSYCAPPVYCAPRYCAPTYCAPSYCAPRYYAPSCYTETYCPPTYYSAPPVVYSCPPTVIYSAPVTVYREYPVYNTTVYCPPTSDTGSYYYGR